jgi:exosortase/archaeosortase family protein
MLNLFVAICVGAAFLLRRPIWERCLIAFSAVPIGIIANIIRIAVTGVLYETAGAELAERVFHDWAGLFMMPLAILLLGIELWVLSKLFLPAPETNVLALNMNDGMNRAKHSRA